GGTGTMDRFIVSATTARRTRGRATAPPGGARAPGRRVEQGRRDHRQTCAGGGRGSVPNPKLDRPEIWENIATIRREEMARAREILGVRQAWLGFVDSGYPEGDPLPPLPEGCFGLH